MDTDAGSRWAANVVVLTLISVGLLVGTALLAFTLVGFYLFLLSLPAIFLTGVVFAHHWRPLWQALFLGPVISFGVVAILYLSALLAASLLVS